MTVIGGLSMSNGNESGALLEDLQRELTACVQRLHATGELDELGRTPLVSTLKEIRVAYEDQNWLPKDLVRVLVDAYPRLREASRSPDFVAQVAKIEAAIVAIPAPKGRSADPDSTASVSKDLSDAAENVYLPIRMLDGLDSHAVDKLMAAIVKASPEIGNSNSIPKGVAEAFISVYSTIDIQRRSSYYCEAEANLMLNAAESILELLRDCLKSS